MAVHTFHATVEQWGRTYGVTVPTDVSVALGIGGHVTVAGRVRGTALQSTLVPIAGAQHRLLLDAATRAAARIAPGDEVEVTLAPDPTDRVPSVPDDLAEALDTIETARSRFDAWPAPHRREILLWIADAQRPETRARRIARALARVMDDA